MDKEVLIKEVSNYSYGVENISETNREILIT